MAKIEIYTKTFCGFCWRARDLLDAKGVKYVEYVIDSGGPKREEMIQRANGRTTVLAAARTCSSLSAKAG